MKSALLLIAISFVSLCMLQNKSCQDKTTGANSAMRSPTATPSGSAAMNTDSKTPDTTSTPTNEGGRKLSGTWGGNHANLQISDQETTIEFDCATGSIRGPLLLDPAGRFDVTGSYEREGPGPVRQETRPEGRAHYSGTVNDATMTLTVRLEGSTEPLLTVSLTRDKQGKLRKCY